MMGIVFFSAILLISFAGRQLRIGLMQIIAILCLLYGMFEYLDTTTEGLMPIYLLLILADIAMIVSGVFRR